HNRHQLSRIVRRRVWYTQRLRKDHHHEQVFFIPGSPSKGLTIRAGIKFVQPVFESHEAILPPAPSGTGSRFWFDHTEVPASISVISSSRSNGWFRVRIILLTEATTTQTAAINMITSITTSNQLPAAMKVPSWIIAAYIETKNTKTNGIMTGHTGRLIRNKMIARIDIVNAANNWFVVPKSGQRTMTPRPSPPTAIAITKPASNLISVAISTLRCTPTTSDSSAVPKRCSRTPVPSVVAANSTALVARMVADT